MLLNAMGLLGGALLLIAGLVNLHEAYVAAGWPSAEGVVVESGVSRHAMSVSPRVSYRYTVRGTTFVGETIFAGQEIVDFTRLPLFNRVYAERVVGRYPTGAAVIVYYNPDDPAIARLERGWSWWALVAVAGGTGLIVWVLVRRRRAQEADAAGP